MSKKRKVNKQQAIEAVTKLSEEQKQHLMNLQVSHLLMEFVYKLNQVQEVMGQKVHFKQAVSLSENDSRTVFIELSKFENTLIE